MSTFFENLRNKQDLTSGECKAYQTYINACILNDFLCDSEVSDFVKTLRQANIKTFIYTNTSSAAMSNIHAFIENGCEFVGTCIVVNGKKGLRFEI